jgi:hypothetical protein
MDKFGDQPNYLHGINKLRICDSCTVIYTISWIRTLFFTENNFRKYVPAFGGFLHILLLLQYLTSRSVLMRSAKKRQMFLFTVSTHLVTTDEYDISIIKTTLLYFYITIKLHKQFSAVSEQVSRVPHNFLNVLSLGLQAKCRAELSHGHLGTKFMHICQWST